MNEDERTTLLQLMAAATVVGFCLGAAPGLRWSAGRADALPFLLSFVAALGTGAVSAGAGLIVATSRQSPRVSGVLFGFGTGLAVGALALLT